MQLSKPCIARHEFCLTKSAQSPNAHRMQTNPWMLSEGVHSRTESVAWIGSLFAPEISAADLDVKIWDPNSLPQFWDATSHDVKLSESPTVDQLMSELSCLRILPRFCGWCVSTGSQVIWTQPRDQSNAATMGRRKQGNCWTTSLDPKFSRSLWGYHSQGFQLDA